MRRTFYVTICGVQQSLNDEALSLNDLLLSQVKASLPSLHTHWEPGLTKQSETGTESSAKVKDIAHKMKPTTIDSLFIMILIRLNVEERHLTIDDLR